MSPMATPLAATYDPVFWVTHNAYERVWAWKRAKPNSAFSDLWHDNNSTCYGHNLHDTLPWRDFLGEGRRADYTNADLLELFDPRNPKLPHVFDTFEWDHCAFDAEVHPSHKPTPAPTLTFAPTGAGGAPFPHPTQAPPPTHRPIPKPTAEPKKARAPLPGVPSPAPTNPTPVPTYAPSSPPSATPSARPTKSAAWTHHPSLRPTNHPVPYPTYQPTVESDDVERAGDDGAAKRSQTSNSPASADDDASGDSKSHTVWCNTHQSLCTTYDGADKASP